MGDRVPISTIPGLISPWVSSPVTILPAGDVYSVVAVFLQRNGHGAGDVVTATLTAGTTIATITLSDGEGEKYDDGVSIEVADSESLVLTVTAADANSENLRGWVEIEGGTAVTTQLTTLARVKRHGNIQGTADDTELNELIASVSARMQEYLRRRIILETITDERYDGPADGDELFVRGWPIHTLTAVRLWDGSTWNTITTDVEARARDLEVGRLVYKPDGSYASWPAGRRNVAIDMTQGYAAVPENLVQAATRQVLYQWVQRNHIGERSTGGDPQVVSTYLIDDWLPGVQQTLDGMREPYARLV